MDGKVYRRCFIVLSLGLFVLWSYLFLCNIGGIQRDVFFWDRNDWFMDFYNTVYYSVGRSPYVWGAAQDRNYLPFCYLLLYPFTFLYSWGSMEWGVAYQARYDQLMAIAGFAFFMAVTGMLFYCLGKACRAREIEKAGMLAAMFCSGVMLYNIDRANLVILSAAFTSVFFMTYDSESRLYRHIGFVSLAIAAALKIFPAMFGVVLLSRKRYKDAAWTICYGVALAALPFLLLNGDLLHNIDQFYWALDAHAEIYSGGPLGLFASTILTDEKSGFGVITWILCAIAVVCACTIRVRWKQVLLFSLALVLSTGQRWYGLIYLLYPMVLFLNEERHSRAEWLYLAAFVLILSPLQFDFTVGFLTFTSRRLINTVCVVMYLYLILESAAEWVRQRRKPAAAQ